MTVKYVGKSILIRPISESDVSSTYLNWLSDPEVNSFLETRHSEQSLDSIRNFVLDKISSDSEFLFAILLNDSETHIRNIKLGTIDPRHLRGDISLFIGDKTQWGKGYASEAIALISKFAFEEKGLGKLNAGCYVQNKGSEKAFLKCGFKQEGYFSEQYLFNGERIDSISLGMTKKEFVALAKN